MGGLQEDYTIKTTVGEFWNFAVHLSRKSIQAAARLLLEFMTINLEYSLKRLRCEDVNELL
jgi:hypothetical protein